MFRRINKIILFISLMVILQGCLGGLLFINIKRTDNYVKRIGKSFSAYENETIAKLLVNLNNHEIFTDQLRGKILLISRSYSDSLVNEVNNRLLKYDQSSDTILVVHYSKENLTTAIKGNPFQKKEIFNALVDKKGKIVGTNIRKIPNDFQSDYYLDYSIFRMKDDLTLRESYINYKWGMIHYCKWTFEERYQDNVFGHWIKNQIDKKIINICN